MSSSSSTSASASSSPSSQRTLGSGCASSTQLRGQPRTVRRHSSARPGTGDGWPGQRASPPSHGLGRPGTCSAEFPWPTRTCAWLVPTLPSGTCHSGAPTPGRQRRRRRPDRRRWIAALPCSPEPSTPSPHGWVPRTASPDPWRSTRSFGVAACPCATGSVSADTRSGPMRGSSTGARHYWTARNGSAATPRSRRSTVHAGR